MSGKRVASLIISVISGLILYMTIMLAIPYGGLLFLFSHPSLYLPEIVLPFIAFCVSVFWFVRLTRSQAPRRATYSSRDFDAYEVFQQIRVGTIPAGWNVFRAERKRVLDRNLIQSGISLFCSLLYGLVLWQMQIDGVALSKIYFAALIPCSLFIFALLTPIFAWKKAKNQILVILPEGFIYSDARKPQTALRVKYRDMREISVVGRKGRVSRETVQIFAKDNLEALNLTHAFAPFPQAALAALLAAFVRYKAVYPDEMITAAPVFVSRFARESRRG